MTRKSWILCGILLLGSLLHAQELRINELMSGNISIIPDEDGAYVDWVEIYNPTDSAIDLDGFALSDDSLSPDKWKFPALTIGPDEYLLVFCSGKDRVPSDEYYETIIRQGDLWKYRLGDSEPPTDWNTIGFDDSGWSAGEAAHGRSGPHRHPPGPEHQTPGYQRSPQPESGSWSPPGPHGSHR